MQILLAQIFKQLKNYIKKKKKGIIFLQKYFCKSNYFKHNPYLTCNLRTEIVPKILRKENRER